MMSKQSPIYVTKPHLPPLEDFIPYLEKIWESGVLTNNGTFHQELEHALCDYLGVSHISLFSNGTIALVAALKALAVHGEVITTPFSFVATAHALRWNNIKPRFVDIDPKTFNLDPKKIEAAITPSTTAILPVHCYGNPCDVDAIDEIAKKYDLSVIYDAAHAFGVECHCGSILNHGDLSVLSFHATKVFNTFEGGAIVSKNRETKTKIDQLKNFGFVDETTVVATGINGKMNEIQAAMGLLQLKTIDSVIERRRMISERYKVELGAVKGIEVGSSDAQKRANYSYFPILVGADYSLSRDGLYSALKSTGIHARRYFFPLISSFPMYEAITSRSSCELAQAKAISDSVLCLPIYPSLSESEQARIIAAIQSPRGVS